MKKQKLDYRTPVLNLLQGTDRLHPKQGPSLARALGLRSDLAVRHTIHDLRIAGHPIASGDNGFWMACDANDLVDTIEHMTNRITGIQRAIEGLRRARFDHAPVYDPLSVAKDRKLEEMFSNI